MERSAIDFHSHVLPGIDDGSKSVEESIQMLTVSARQGITYMAATPHFYPSENDPEQFLVRRKRAFEQLREAWSPEYPRLLLGAEVYYFEGISRAEKLEMLRIESSTLFLLEMPFQTWTERMVSEVLALHNRPHLKVLLAHIERYLPYQKRSVWETLREAGVLMQSNASFFLRWNTKHKALRMLESGQIHLLGSDCHNMADRPPRLGEALEIIGENGRRELEQRSRWLMEFEEVSVET